MVRHLHDTNCSFEHVYLLLNAPKVQLSVKIVAAVAALYPLAAIFLAAVAADSAAVAARVAAIGGRGGGKGGGSYGGSGGTFPVTCHKLAAMSAMLAAVYVLAATY